MGRNGAAMSAALFLGCLLLFHSSDGSLIWIESEAIKVLRPAPAYHDHVARGTKTIIYTSTGKTFGVSENYDQVTSAVKTACPK
jgi:hypothetical protein